MEQTSPLPNTPTTTLPPIVTTTQINPSRSNKPLLLIFLTVLVILLISLNAYLFMKLQNQPKTPVASPAPIIQSSPTPTSDPTANWKKYTNTQYGYSLKYPNDWIYDDNYPDNVAFSIRGTKLAEGTPTFVVNTSNKPVLAYDKKELDSYKELPIQIDGVAGKLTSGILNGEVLGSISGMNFKGVVLEKNNRFYQIASYDYNGSSYGASFDQILSTFKFVE